MKYNYRNFVMLYIRIMVFFSLLFLYACGGGGGGGGDEATQQPNQDDPESTTPPPNDPPNDPPEDPPVQTVSCDTHQQSFLDDVWPILKSQCFSCHEIDKVTSELQLAGETIADYNILNFNTFKKVTAKTDNSNLSLLLSKPANTNNDHSGGERFAADSTEYQVFEDMVDKLTTCEDKAKTTEGLLLNSPYQQLRKITLSLASRLPTAEEEQFVTPAASKDALAAELEAVTDKTLNEEAFYTRLKEIFNDLLLLDAFSGTFALQQFDLRNFDNKDYFDSNALDATEFGYSTADRNLIRQNANFGLTQEPLELIAHVARNNRPFTEILTANYLLVNPYSATIYGADVGDPDFNFKYKDTVVQHNRNEFREAVITDNNGETYPHAGILSSLTFLRRYPTTNTNRNRARARYVFLYFLDTNVEGLADRAGLDLENVIGDFPPFEDPQCRTCHDTVDPVAGLFKNWANEGRYRGNYSNWFSERNPQQMLSPGYTLAESDQLPTADGRAALQWLAGRIVQDSRFALSVTKTMFKGITGQQPPLQDSQFIDDLKTKFVDSNYNIKALAKEIVNSNYFKAANLGAGENANDYTEMGMAHLLTPQQLHRKIRAVTGGYTWRSPTNRTLTDRNTYNLLYGGIDSLDVSERTTEPTTLISGVQERIALQASCEIVPLDFDKPQGERALFPMVNVSDKPDGANGSLGAIKIKQNIQHLYKQLLGKELNIDDPEIDRAFALFENVRTATDDGQIPQDCRGSLAAGNPVRVDADKTVIPWMAVVAYMFLDFQFLYE